MNHLGQYSDVKANESSISARSTSKRNCACFVASGVVYTKLKMPTQFSRQVAKSPMAGSGQLKR